MGRPTELTDTERADLRAQGFRPVEVWVPDWDNPIFLTRIEADFSAIRQSDRRADMNETLDAFLRDNWSDLDR